MIGCSVLYVYDIDLGNSSFLDVTGPVLYSNIISIRSKKVDRKKDVVILYW